MKEFEDYNDDETFDNVAVYVAFIFIVFLIIGVIFISMNNYGKSSFLEISKKKESIYCPDEGDVVKFCTGEEYAVCNCWINDSRFSATGNIICETMDHRRVVSSCFTYDKK